MCMSEMHGSGNGSVCNVIAENGPSQRSGRVNRLGLGVRVLNVKGMGVF